VNMIYRLVRIGLAGAIGVYVTGCCIVPLHGWGHEHRGYGERFEGRQVPEQTREREGQRNGSDWQRR
jgi:hypothetical protein